MGNKSQRSNDTVPSLSLFCIVCERVCGGVLEREREKRSRRVAVFLYDPYVPVVIVSQLTTCILITLSSVWMTLCPFLLLPDSQVGW